MNEPDLQSLVDFFAEGVEMDAHRESAVEASDSDAEVSVNGWISQFKPDSLPHAELALALDGAGIESKYHPRPYTQHEAVKRALSVQRDVYCKRFDKDVSDYIIQKHENHEEYGYCIMRINRGDGTLGNLNQGDTVIAVRPSYEEDSGPIIEVTHGLLVAELATMNDVYREALKTCSGASIGRALGRLNEDLRSEAKAIALGSGLVWVNADHGDTWMQFREVISRVADAVGSGARVRRIDMIVTPDSLGMLADAAREEIKKATQAACDSMSAVNSDSSERVLENRAEKVDQLRSRVNELSNLLPFEDMHKDMQECLARADQAVAIARSESAASVYEDTGLPSDIPMGSEDY